MALSLKCERDLLFRFHNPVRAVICCFELQMYSPGQCEVWMKFSIVVTNECAVVLVIVPANVKYLAHTSLKSSVMQQRSSFARRKTS